MLNKGEGPAKVLAEFLETRVIDGMFCFEFQSGTEKYGFAIPLAMAKALGPAITKQVEEIEKKTGRSFDGGEAKTTVPSPWSPTQ